MNNENNAKLKIAVVCHIFNPESGGGMETALYELLKALSCLAEITVITSSADDTARKLPVKFIFLPVIKSDLFLVRYFSFLLSWKLFRIFRKPRKTFEVIYSSSPLFKGADVCAVHFLSASYIDILWKEKMADMTWELKLKHLHRIYSHSVGACHERKIYNDIANGKINTILLPVSAGIAEELKKYYNMPDDKIMITPNPYKAVPQSKQSVKAVRNEITESKGWNLEESFILLFAGGNWERKGLSDTIRCLKLLPPSAKLIVAGEGNVSDYGKLCTSEGVSERVAFIGRRSDMPTLYSISNTLILLSSFEALPMVCIEAMSYGLPLVLYPFIGSETLVRQDENGFIATDIKKTADHILNLMKAPPLYKRLADGSRQMASAFRPQRIAQDVLAICENIYKAKSNE